MHKRGLIAAALVIAFGLAAWLRAAQPGAPANQLTELAKARAEAARKTYDVVSKNFREGLVPFGELPYRWSTRWLDADLTLSDKQADKLKAYRAHLARMMTLEQVTRDRYRSRVITIDEVTGAEFFTLEARLWVEQVLAGKK
jgi:hypothetical protein